jgi:hypothetical protein
MPDCGMQASNLRNTLFIRVEDCDLLLVGCIALDTILFARRTSAIIAFEIQNFRDRFLLPVVFALIAYTFGRLIATS